MKITACLCWYDEPIAHLKRCVTSLAGFAIVDDLVALDGRWQPYPGERVLSPMDQAIALRHAARALGLDLHEQGRYRPWPSQIEKRSASLELATIHGADWLLVIDADEWIHHADPHTIRDALATTDHDVATITIRNTTGHDHPNTDQPRRRLFRAGTTVEHWHNGYTRNGRTLAGDPPLAPALDLTDHLRIHHTPRARSPERNAAAKHYRHARARLGER
ncbi:MAG TPA: hypothetical protein VHD91_08435 [Gaiellaceae bacterium]|nr:hypothetical protein [Gaiellaceae bacterium]